MFEVVFMGCALTGLISAPKHYEAKILGQALSYSGLRWFSLAFVGWGQTEAW